jgi:hypothetical protein
MRSASVAASWSSKRSTPWVRTTSASAEAAVDSDAQSTRWPSESSSSSVCALAHVYGRGWRAAMFRTPCLSVPARCQRPPQAQWGPQAPHRAARWVSAGWPRAWAAAPARGPPAAAGWDWAAWRLGVHGSARSGREKRACASASRITIGRRKTIRLVRLRVAAFAAEQAAHQGRSPSSGTLLCVWWCSCPRSGRRAPGSGRRPRSPCPSIERLVVDGPALLVPAAVVLLTALCSW